MPRIERRYRLNSAQLRNLRHWSEKERPSKTLAVVVPLTGGIPAQDAIRAVHALIGRHEALRARLASDSRGNCVQEVLTPGDATAELEVDSVELPAGAAADTIPERIVPEESSVRCTLSVRGDRVCAVKLSVSHVFTDALGMRTVARDLRTILRGGLPDPLLPRQAGEYARGPQDPVLAENTRRWQALLADAPRSCTYAAVPREEYESVRHVWVPLAAGHAEAIARKLRVSPYILWSAVISAYVELVSGQHRQVFRSTYANRATSADLHAVAQLAQAVYLPVEGTAHDTFQARVEQISQVTRRTRRWGDYDAAGMLDWLNGPAVARGAIFQPAFELNYLPRGGRGAARPVAAGVQDSLVRIDPPSAKADLAVLVTQEPAAAVRFSVRRPVGARRAAQDVAADCLLVLRGLGEHPGRPIKEVPVRPFGGEFLLGHRSGVAVAEAATCDLVRSFPGVTSCALEMCRDGSLIAHVSASRPVTASGMLPALRERQPWLSGSVVPDRVVVTC